LCCGAAVEEASSSRVRPIGKVVCIKRYRRNAAGAEFKARELDVKPK
jgi:hypothetical protein